MSETLYVLNIFIYLIICIQKNTFYLLGGFSASHSIQKIHKATHNETLYGIKKIIAIF